MIKAKEKAEQGARVPGGVNQITLSKESVTCVSLSRGLEEGNRIATLLEVIMNKDFIVSNFGTLMFLPPPEEVTDSKGKPLEGDSLYEIDRKSGQIKKIPLAFSGFWLTKKVPWYEPWHWYKPWHEKLIVYGSALRAIKNGKPVVLSLSNYDEGYLSLSGTYRHGEDYDWPQWDEHRVPLIKKTGKVDALHASKRDA
ncbi:MAG: hypothetical protein QW759_01925 [Candidatus Micrarchaeaceae archaeon]